MLMRAGSSEHCLLIDAISTNISCADPLILINDNTGMIKLGSQLHIMRYYI